MFDKIEEIEKKYVELTNKISDPDIISNQDEYRKCMKEHSNLEDVVEKYREYKKEKQNMDEAQEMMKEKEMKDFAEDEYYSDREKMEKIEEELKYLLLPKDENDDSNVIIEIRGGAGGEEAALFAYNLYRMYRMYAELKRWQVEVIDLNETEIGGIKEISFMIK